MAEEKKMSVEESFAELDRMVEKLESSDVTLEESFQIYQKGMNLLKDVSRILDGYEKKIQLLNGDGTTEDLEVKTGTDEETT